MQILQPATSTSTQICDLGCLEPNARANSAAGNVDLNADPTLDAWNAVLMQILQLAKWTSQICDLGCLERSTRANSAAGNVDLNADLRFRMPGT